MIEEELELAQQELDNARKRVEKVKEKSLLENLAEALNGLREVKADIKELNVLESGVDALTKAVNDLSIRVDNELLARKSQREKENRVLNELSKYMSDWH